jgi:hypothetical protein
MAILWMDGMDGYSSITDMATRYPGTNTSIVGFYTTGGRFGGGTVSTNNASNSSYLGNVVIPHTTSAIIVGGAHNVGVGTNSDYPMFLLMNTTTGATTNELSLRHNSGTLQLYRGGSSTLLAAATMGVAQGVWHHIEMKATIADSGGTCEVRLNGVTVITYTGDTRNSTSGTAGVDRVAFGTVGSTLAAGGLWDDIYVLDTTGAAANNFLGDVRINQLLPTSDSSVQFTRSTGASNFSCVDEGKHNTDTDYVESSTVGHIDRYGFADLPASATSVHGVQAVTWAKKTDAGTRTLRNIIYSGSGSAAGTTIGLTTTYAAITSVASVDPDTGTAWTPTTANAATAGYEIIA